jgi:hypothetical protein
LRARSQLTAKQRRDLLEIVDDQHRRTSTVAVCAVLLLHDVNSLRLHVNHRQVLRAFSSGARRLESNFVDGAIGNYQDRIAERSFVYLPLWLLPRSA